MLSGPNHYETLGVSRAATQEEIKKAFRRLSVETHPDLNKETHGDGEKFKVIANAHSVLSSPAERRKYDRDLQEALMWRGGGGMRAGSSNGFYGGGTLHRQHGRPHKPGLHVAVETLSHPRYVLMGLLGFGGVAVVGSMLGGLSSKRPEYHPHEPMVEAWKNPATGRYEQPAPWDPAYQRLRPKLEMVPREKVRRRHLE